MLRVNKTVLTAGAVGSIVALAIIPLASATGTIIQSRICLPFGTPTITDPAQDITDNDPSVMVSGTADPNVTVGITDNGTGSGATSTDSTGAYSIAVPLEYGTNVLQAQVTNACDTVNSSNTVKVTHPAPVTPPSQPEPTVSSLQPVTEPTTQTSTASLSSPTSGSLPTSVPTYAPPVMLAPLSGLVVTKPYVTITGKAEPLTVIQIVDNGEIVAQVITSTNGIFSVRIPLSSGIHSLVAQITTNTGVLRTQTTIVSYAPDVTSDRGIIARATAIGGILAVVTGGGIALHALAARAGVTAKLRKRKR